MKLQKLVDSPARKNIRKSPPAVAVSFQLFDAEPTYPLRT